MSGADLLFYFFATLSVGGGLLMVFSRHPVSAAMFMIISLVGVASLFVLLDAFFLAILQVLVYAGAVMVLFLFIIMLLDVGPGGAKASRLKLLSGVAGLIAVGLLVVLLLDLGLGSTDPSLCSAENCEDCGEAPVFAWPEIRDETAANGNSLVFSPSVKAFGFGLLAKYMLPLQVAGFLLLSAMVGVIILSKKSAIDEEA
jgi:NADH-quinone oxidoreductase subunit J